MLFLIDHPCRPVRENFAFTGGQVSQSGLRFAEKNRSPSRPSSEKRASAVGSLVSRKGARLRASN
ncbi:MAG: hypothetical protein A3I66_02670 [Burkholderiales bacterium RIFCSPLOWO2_02_FULL_57_36]|nr:MAG: hypothetical protein A3I66_02670 [Burkholderiales bacterium RIFCSPLOWO2_02_FULL_57_36]